MSKPDLRFFEHVIEAVPYVAEEILYVGDLLDNDIHPAAKSGMAWPSAARPSGSGIS